ncbi:MAG: methyl-accepting chemotaxis protein [Clostridium sp.]|uniref:methyl-accepting chemotaxis protein n=1 Tax=Clostridium sp. TaxID=1506 RepID=UPI002A885FF8|nr:methyl-accepting chemotaxis protein [Clostridium sp.]MDY5097671.1 methyl-accepting chemotaxis protein [Clostridium sp.]
MVKNLKLNFRCILSIFITSSLIFLLSFISVKILDIMEEDNSYLYTSGLSIANDINLLSQNISSCTIDASKYLYMNNNDEVSTSAKNTIITSIYNTDKVFENIKKSNLNEYNYMSASNLSIYYSNYKKTLFNLMDAIDDKTIADTEALYLSFTDITDSINTTVLELTNSITDLYKEKYMENFSKYNLFRSHLILLSFFTIAITILIGIYSFMHIAKVFKRCTDFANKIYIGDLTSHIEEEDDPLIMNLYNALNRATEQTREVITSIRIASTTLNNSSLNLSKVTNEIKNAINTIDISSKDIMLKNLDAYNTVDKIEFDLDNITSNIIALLDKTNECSNLSTNMKQRTEGTISTNTKFLDVISSTYREKCALFESSFNEIKIISSIQKLTDIIYYMSKKSSILAANASIEATRSSENNKGFLVVADEVRKLSIEAFNISANVHEVMDSVNKNIDTLNTEINQSINFVSLKLYPQINSLFRDFDLYVDNAKNMMNIAQSLRELNSNLTRTLNDIKESISTMSSLSANSTSKSNEILLTVSLSYSYIEDMHNLSLKNADVSQNLNKIISYFKV